MKRIQLGEGLRITGLLIAITGLGLLATGCSLRPSSTATVKVSQVRIWRTDQSSDTMTQVISDFEQNTKNVDVTYTRKSTQNYELESYKSLAAREGPDIWSFPDDWLPDEFERLIPLPDNYYVDAKKKETRKPGEVVKDLYPAGIADQITGPDGKVYGLPTGVDVLRLYYNPDLFSAALSDFRKSEGDNVDEAKDATVRQLLTRAPATWADVISATPYLTQHDGSTINRGAIAFGSAYNIPNSADILQLLMMQNGAKIVSTDRRNALFHIPQSTPAGGTVNPGLNALDFFTSFADPTKDNYSWNAGMPQALDAFAQGKVAMVIGFSDFGNTLKIKYPKFQFEEAPVPQISSSPIQPAVNLITFKVETVTKVADNPNLAFAFLSDYTTSNNASTIARGAKLTTPYLSKLQDNKNEFPSAQILSGVSVYKKNHDLFDAAFRQMVVDITQNGLPSDQALAAGAETVNLLLSDKQDEQP